MDLLERISTRSAHVAVVGLGYVGLPLAVELARAGFLVTGLDVDAGRVASLAAGRSHVEDVPSAEVVRENLRFTAEPRALAEADAVVICVPTPLGAERAPDLRCIESAVASVAAHSRPGALVVLESTSYPGTTRELLLPRLQGRHVAFSPERVDPGNPDFGIWNTPKVVGGATEEALALACALYAQVVESVVPVTSLEVAETAKLLENTFRAVNIALANELAQVSRALGVDAREVIAAAATKPFGFMPFWPGPGVGGHCIPVDPVYLTWKLRELGVRSPLIDTALDVNEGMPAHVVGRVRDALDSQGKSLEGARVLVYGVAYKPNVGDCRESPALEVIDLLARAGAHVEFCDPHVPEVRFGDGSLRSVDPNRSFSDFDVVAVLTDHAQLDRDRLLSEAHAVVDTRGALGKHEKVLGL